MRKSRFSESQKLSILKELESGVKVSELCRKHGVAQNTIYKWRSKYGGMELSDIKKLNIVFSHASLNFIDNILQKSHYSKFSICKQGVKRSCTKVITIAYSKLYIKTSNACLLCSGRSGHFCMSRNNSSGIWAGLSEFRLFV